MNTIVKNWKIVSIYDGNEFIGDVLYATVVEDTTGRFYKDDYVTTSKVIKFDLTTKLITTSSNSLYQLLGEGSYTQIDFDDFELLRHGLSPDEIGVLRKSNCIAH